MTDEEKKSWWQDIVNEYEAYKAQCKGSALEDFCAELSMAFLNQHERVYKKGKR